MRRFVAVLLGLSLPFVAQSSLEMSVVAATRARHLAGIVHRWEEPLLLTLVASAFAYVALVLVVSVGLAASGTLRLVAARMQEAASREAHGGVAAVPLPRGVRLLLMLSGGSARWPRWAYVGSTLLLLHFASLVAYQAWAR